MIKSDENENERLSDLPCWDFDETFETLVGDIDTYSCKLYLDKFVDYKSLSFEVTEKNINSKSVVDLYKIENDAEIFLTQLNSTTNITRNYTFPNDVEEVIAKFRCDSDEIQCEYDLKIELDWKLEIITYIIAGGIVLIFIIGILALIYLLYILLRCLCCCCCEEEIAAPGEEEAYNV